MVNRNNALGRYGEFAPVRYSLDEIVAMAGGKKRFDAQPPVTVADLGEVTLVRYRLGSGAIDEQGANMGIHSFDYTDAPDITSVFGVIDKASGKAGAVIVIYDQASKPEISHLFTSEDVVIAPEAMCKVLNYLDVPASRHQGADLQIARRADCWYEDDTWVVREPRYLVVQSYERVCFAVDPVIRETIDITLLENENFPLDGGGESEAAYWNKDFYRAAGFDRMREMGVAGRAGFSSWLPKETRRVKVVGTSLDPEIEMLEAASDPGFRVA